MIPTDEIISEPWQIEGFKVRKQEVFKEKKMCEITTDYQPTFWQKLLKRFKCQPNK